MKKALVVVLTLLAVGVGVLAVMGGWKGEVRMNASTTITGRATEVFRFISAPDKLPEWVEGLEFSHETSAHRFGVGSRIHTTVNVHGRSFPVEVEVTAYEPPRLLALRQESDFYSGDVRYDLLERDGVTLITSTAAGRYKGPLRLLSPIEQPAAQHRAEQSLLRLKLAVEDKTLR